MTQQPVISVRGSASVEADAELALFSVTVKARGPDRKAVLSRLATRNAQVLAVIRSYGEGVENLGSGPASVYPEPRKGNKPDEGVAYFAGHAVTVVTLSDFSVLGELVTRLAGGDMVTVTGPWWSLRPDSPVHRQAQTAATEDALRRAAQYARDFGVQLGPLLEAGDPGMLTGVGEHAMDNGTRGSAAARGGPAADEPGLDFEPVRQVVERRVDARFGIAPALQ